MCREGRHGNMFCCRCGLQEIKTQKVLYQPLLDVGEPTAFVQYSQRALHCRRCLMFLLQYFR